MSTCFLIEVTQRLLCLVQHVNSLFVTLKFTYTYTIFISCFQVIEGSFQLVVKAVFLIKKNDFLERWEHMRIKSEDQKLFQIVCRNSFSIYLKSCTGCINNIYSEHATQRVGRDVSIANYVVVAEFGYLFISCEHFASLKYLFCISQL